MESLFGTSGVRGKLGTDINSELAYNLARSFSKILENQGGKEVVIGRDTRSSGEMIEKALSSGFVSMGVNVENLGVVPTPVVGLHTKERQVGGGVMITASHNPPEYNGIKLFNSNGEAISPEREKEIEKIYSSNVYNGFEASSWDKLGGFSEFDPIDSYLENIIESLEIGENFEIVVGCGNGPSSKTTPELLRRLNVDVVTLNSQMDGFFPGRASEPTADNLEDLRNFMSSSEYDLGIAHDGDGDRIAIVDDDGNLVNQDLLISLVGSYYAEEYGTGTVTTVGASKVVDEEISKAGGEVFRTKVGDVNVASKMKEESVLFGGEPSGTWIMNDVHMCPDGTLAAVKVLEMLSEREETLSELVNETPTYPISRSKVDCLEGEKEEKMSRVEERLDSEFDNIQRKITVDGIRLELGDGSWILIRPSGTEPYIRITVEADEDNRVNELMNKAKTILKKV